MNKDFFSRRRFFSRDGALPAGWLVNKGFPWICMCAVLVSACGRKNMDRTVQTNSEPTATHIYRYPRQ